MTQTNKNPESNGSSSPKSERDLFAEDWDQNISTAPRRSRLARSEKARANSQPASAQDASYEPKHEHHLEISPASASSTAVELSDTGHETADSKPVQANVSSQAEPVLKASSSGASEKTAASAPADTDRTEKAAATEAAEDPLFASPKPLSSVHGPVRRRRNIVVPAIVLTLALVGGSLGAAWFLNSQGGSSSLKSLKVAEQKQYDDYAAWLDGLAKPADWSEETFNAVKTAALNAYDRTQLDQIEKALDGDDAAKAALEGKSEVSEQTVLSEYKNLLENAGQYPEQLVAAAVKDPGLLHFVLEYPKYANSQGQDVTLVSVAEMPDLKTFDPNWGYMNYGSSIFALTGGAPTAISDIFSYLRDDPTITPYAVGKWAEQFDYDKTPIRDTDDSIFGGAALTWGVSMNPVPTYKTQITSYLEQGYPMIIAVGTLENPQFYVLNGVDEKGDWKAYNPVSSDSPTTLDPDQTADQLVKAYAFW